MKVKETVKGKVTSNSLSGKRKTTGNKTAKSKVPAKRHNQNLPAEISKIHNKLKAVCIRLYKAEKENQRLLCMILWGVPVKRKLQGK